MADGWSREEVEATVADYFAMLQSELRGEAYSKTAHRRQLSRMLANRSDPAIERKHMNISAVLRDLDHPWIDGYKPYSNYQRLLAEVVQARLQDDVAVLGLVRQQVEAPASVPAVTDQRSPWEDPPPGEGKTSGVAEHTPSSYDAVPRIGVDYLAMEARNRSLGQAGEEFVLRVEAERLHSMGHRRLADRVEHVARSKGDGLGYDILSFEPNGRERLIEVKTTSFGKRTPFYVSRAELGCSAARSEDYHLYRVFQFRREPRLFSLAGRLDATFRLDAHQYIARTLW